MARSLLTFSLGALITGALLLLVARTSKSELRAAPDDPVSEPSYFLRKVRGAGIEIDKMSPRLISPLAEEAHLPPRKNCVVLPGKGDYAGIRPYLVAMGELDLQAPKEGELAREVTDALAKTWKELRAVAGKPVGTPLLRILTKHYPRDDLPGRCFTIQVTFFTVRDPYFDDGGLTPELAERVKGKVVDGLMFEVRKTYQTKNAQRRLIEAEVEVTEKVGGYFGRKSFPQLSGLESVSGFAGDEFFGAHFQLYGGGERRGLVWYDRSFGLGKADVWAGVFRAIRSSEAAQKVKTAKLPPKLTAALLSLVERA
jgi:hypothetical protein